MGGTRSGDGRQLRWEKHKRERRQVVIDAAVEVLELHPAGTAVHVQEIADRAGIHRTVLYRHFEDRTDLDLAVQTEICRRAGDTVIAAMSLEGTPSQITHRIVATFVEWMVDHPALVRFVERDLSGGDVTPLEQSLQQVAERVELLMHSIVQMLGTELPEESRDALDPFVFGLIGSGFQTTKRWASRPELRPPPRDFIDLLSRNIWRQITGMAADNGIELPDVPVEALLTLLTPEPSTTTPGA
ncbi:TetR/AcrR family transcriptional regulator [Nocardioides sp. GY 10113]|uniref:TetR/AcrR family transcriptional regulator n=1 Tax=Nocardioides sp. GY 10113 TaxID=2569761 RepID=UPI0010A7BF3A|nr:TetR/AcrR family transcriptional regulator [Nocardioides sp. GY 10113]TIC89041.1 TetR/AcrR family transcriptional regulator [Nocardioides sp. GY 10113]